MPALLYTICNVMVFVGYANLEAALGMVTYQTKILFTAFFSVVLLKRKLYLNQWIAIAILAIGVVFAQGVFDSSLPAHHPPPPPPATVQGATQAAIASGSLAITPSKPRQHPHPHPHISESSSHKSRGGKPRRLFSLGEATHGEAPTMQMPSEGFEAAPSAGVNPAWLHEGLDLSHALEGR